MSPTVALAAEVNLPDIAFFSVQAQAEPGVMPRVLELFAKRGLVPSGWRSAVSGAEPARLTIEIQMSGLDRQITEYIGACLRQIASVDSVLAWRQGAGRS